MNKHPRAFIFDLDGVITDTAELHFLAWKKLALELGITIDREFNETLKGISRMDSLERILQLKASLHLSKEEKEALATKKNEHYQELIKTITPAEILPGIEKLLNDIRKNNLLIGLGSASKNAKLVLQRLGLTNYFDYIVDAAEINKGKPDPETFLNAVQNLNLPRHECIGIEDAAAGVTAIREAGMFAVGIGSEEHLAHAHYVVQTTDELVFEQIIKQYQYFN